MTDPAETALLPAGLQDLLPPDAEREAAVLEQLVSSFAASGYERIKPPLMEFEDTLLSGAGRAVARESFRLMDPVSQRMMALRADMTPRWHASLPRGSRPHRVLCACAMAARCCACAAGSFVRSASSPRPAPS